MFIPRTQTQKPNKIEKIDQSDELKLSLNMRERLLALQNKGINVEELLEEFLDQREERIQEEKHKIAEELIEREKKTSPKDNLLKADQSGLRSKTSPSRYIPVKIKRLLKQEYGQKCAQEICTNKATNIHHTRRFGLNSSHNPLFLAPLCKSHHEIAHSIDVKVQEKKRSITE